MRSSNLSAVDLGDPAGEVGGVDGVETEEEHEGAEGEEKVSCIWMMGSDMISLRESGNTCGGDGRCE